MDDLHVSRIMTTSQAFFHPLDPQEVEVIFAPLHDPLLSDRVPLTLESGEATAPRIELDWCSATISWDDCPPGATAALVHCAVNRDVKAFSHYLACLNVPRGVTYRFLADFGNGLVPVSEEITGSSSRDEVMQPLRTTQGGSSTLLKSFCLELKSVTGGAQRLSVSWFGLRNEARYQAMRKGRKRSTEKNWDTFLLPEKEWGEWRFARGLLFDEAALEAVCKKGSSLLAIGITKVNGSFQRGSVVSLHDPSGQEIARGLCNYPSSEVEKISGQPSDKISEVLGHRPYENVIHRDNLVLTAT